MNVVTLSGLKQGKLSRTYRGKCKTRKAYSPTLKKDVIVCSDGDEPSNLGELDDRPPRRRAGRRPRREPLLECQEFGWVETRNGRRMCRCLTPGMGRIQPNEKCLDKE